MYSQSIDKNENLDKVSGAIIQWFESLALPSKNYWEMVIILLTLVDDFLRNIAMGTDETNKIATEIKYNHFQSEFVYDLKHVLSLTGKKLEGTQDQIKEFIVNDQKMRFAFQLLLEANKYESFIRCWSTVTMDSKEWSFNPANSSFFIAEPRMLPTVIYQGIEVGKISTHPAFYLKVLILYGLPEGIPHLVALSAKKVSSNKIKYSFNDYLARQLSVLVPKYELPLRNRWSFPWGSEQEMGQFHHALVTRCIYHFIAVHYGSILLGIEGYGVNNLCMIIKRKTLIKELQIISDLSEEKIDKIISAITYGNNTKNPDPALQPIFAPTKDLLIIAPIFTSSVSLIRNSFSLHSRVDPKSFNSQSQIFEKSMIQDIESSIKSKGYEVRFGFKIPQTKLEVDLLIADKRSNLILLGELKWFNDPGDIREVVDKKKAIDKGMDQLVERLQYMQTRKRDTLRDVFGIKLTEGQENEWNLKAILILDGYFNFPEHLQGNIIVVPKDVFEIGMRKIPSLEKFILWLSSCDWHPIEGFHYKCDVRGAEVGCYKFMWDTFSPLEKLANYLDFVEQSTFGYLLD